MKSLLDTKRWLWMTGLCLLCVSVLLAACGLSAESLAHATLAAMTQTAAAAVVVPTSTPPESLSALEETSPAVPVPPATETSWVQVNISTATPLVHVAPQYATFTTTPTPTISLTPTRGPSPWATRRPTDTATVTATPKPPSAALRISVPGEGSRIISPFQFQAAIARGEDQMVYVNLIGENGQVFYAETLDYRNSSFNRLMIAPTLTFTLPDVAENARLVLHTLDLQGRVMALSSVDMVLLSIGSNQVNPAQHDYAPFLIDAPREGAELKSGRLIVSGRAAALNDNPVIIELLDDNGAVIAGREMRIDPPPAGEPYMPFVIELDVQVSQVTQARLVIRQESAGSIPGTVALNSAAITVLP